MVLAVLAGDVATDAPVAPALAQGALEDPALAGVVARLRAQEVLQGALVAAEHELLGDPSLGVHQVAEALLVEVVRDAESSDHVAVRDQALALEGTQVPQADLEGVAVAVLGAERLRGPADVDELELGAVERGPPAAGYAHVLLGHALAVLQPRHGHVRHGDLGQLGQDLGRLDGGQLALGHLVDLVSSRGDEDVVLEQLAHAEVVGLVLEFHRVRCRLWWSPVQDCRRFVRIADTGIVASRKG